MVRLASSILIFILGAVALPGGAAPPSRPAHRRAPAPDPEKEKLKQNLADATSAIGTLDSRVLELMGATAELRRQLEASTLASARLQQSLDDARQTAASLQARLKSAEERADKAEREKTQKLAAAPAPRVPSAEDARLAAQLDDIQRRRDNYIASVLRRYRDLANEYRSFGSALAIPNERDVTAKSGPELNRIQNTIALVEEDLRQLNGLEAQAALVRKAKSKMP